MSRASRSAPAGIRTAFAALIVVAWLLVAFVAGAGAATTASSSSSSTTASATTTVATTTSVSSATNANTTASSATPTTTTPAASSAAASPKVKLKPSGSGKGTSTRIAIHVSGCPKGSIKIDNTIDDSSQTISGNGAPATMMSHGKPGNYRFTAVCHDGTKASAVFAVTTAKGPSVTLNPASTGPKSQTVHVHAEGCPPGDIKITDTINGGSQTIKHNNAPATIPSEGNPGTYKVTATCAADGDSASGVFVVDSSNAPHVSLDPSSTGPVTKTIDVKVTGCPTGKIKITDTINGGSQTIKHNNAPATIVSEGDPGTYTVTAHCSDGQTANAQFVVGPNGPIQTGGGALAMRGSGPGWPRTLGLALIALGCLGAGGLFVRRRAR